MALGLIYNCSYFYRYQMIHACCFIVTLWTPENQSFSKKKILCLYSYSCLLIDIYYCSTCLLYPFIKIHNLLNSQYKSPAFFCSSLLFSFTLNFSKTRFLEGYHVILSICTLFWSRCCDIACSFFFFSQLPSYTTCLRFSSKNVIFYRTMIS